MRLSHMLGDIKGFSVLAVHVDPTPFILAVSGYLTLMRAIYSLFVDEITKPR